MVWNGEKYFIIGYYLIKIFICNYFYWEFVFMWIVNIKV